MSAPRPAATGLRDPLRLIALFEALKGLAALAGMLGLLGLLHHDLHQMAADLIGRFPLDPDGRLPSAILHGVDHISAMPPSTVLLLGLAYVAARWIEGWGLWRGRAWGEWFGVLSGALYVPFEVRHLLHRPGPTAIALLLTNVAVVAYLALRLWRRRSAEGAGQGAGDSPRGSH